MGIADDQSSAFSAGQRPRFGTTLVPVTAAAAHTQITGTGTETRTGTGTLPPGTRGMIMRRS